MATYRILDPTGTVVDTKDITSAEDAHQWYMESKDDSEPLGWRMEVRHDDDSWALADDSEASS